jgi:acetylornithine deacetylase/succinyl-diaminopimelate desuccinylase-like protein
MKNGICGVLAGAAMLTSMTAAWSQALSPATPQLRPDQVEFRSLYKELVETNTSLSVGSCTLAAARMQAHLAAAGFPASDLHPFADPSHPKEGGLVAVLPGTDPMAKPILLLAHLDVVEAKRADWRRDPFTLV